MTDVIFPRMDQGMTSGVLLEWLVSAGSIVTRGQPIATIETDKITLELESPADGRLDLARWQPGDEVPVGDVVATVNDPATEAPSDPGSAPPRQSEPAEPPQPLAHDALDLHARDLAQPLAARSAPLLPVDRTGWQRPHDQPPRRRVAPGLAAPVTQASRSDRPRVPVTRRGVIDAVTASRQVPQFQVEADVPLASLLRLVAELPNLASGARVSATDLLVRAAALAVAAAPVVASSWVDDAPRPCRETVDVNLLLASADELYNPVLRAANRRSPGELAGERRRLVDAAASRSLLVDDLRVGALSVSNLGTTRIDRFNALVFPPQVAVLAVARARKEKRRAPAWITLSVDHRAVDGMQAAVYLDALRDLLEHPAAILVP